MRLLAFALLLSACVSTVDIVQVETGPVVVYLCQ